MHRSLVAFVAVGLVSLLALQPATAASKDEIKAMLERTFDVEVLRMRETEVDGRAALAVTVMNRAGNSNAAFLVNTLVVDMETGALVPQFRHLPSGYTTGGGGPRELPEDTGERGRRLLTQTR